MGGQIFVGFRTDSGKEHIGLTWTNWLPTLFADPVLYRGEGGEALQRFRDALNKASPGYSYDQWVPRIRNTEYGVVLLDIPSNEVWDSNGYFSPLCLIVPPHGYGDDRLAAAKKVITGRHFTKIYPHFKPELAFSEAGIRTWLQAASMHPNYELPIVAIDLNLATYAHHDSRGPTKKTWAELQTWVKARGWKSPINKCP